MRYNAMDRSTLIQLSIATSEKASHSQNNVTNDNL